MFKTVIIALAALGLVGAVAFLCVMRYAAQKSPSIVKPEEQKRVDEYLRSKENPPNKN